MIEKIKLYLLILILNSSFVYCQNEFNKNGDVLEAAKDSNSKLINRENAKAHSNQSINTTNINSDIHKQTSKSRFITESEILENPDKLINESQLITGDDSIKNQMEVQKAYEQVQFARSKANNNVESTQGQREYVNKIYKILYVALKKFNLTRYRNTEVPVELILMVGTQEDGSYVILSSVLAPQGASFILPNKTEFIIHYHHRYLERKPSIGDHALTKIHNMVNFTLTSNGHFFCCQLYEVGRQNGKYVYRRIINNTTVGNWHKRREWNK